MKRMLKLRKKLNAALEASGQGLRISLNDMLIQAVGTALTQCPGVNVRWTSEATEQLAQVDVSVAVSTERGLITPVVKNAGEKKLTDIARDAQGLIARAREGKLTPAEYQGGSISLSNLGMCGVREFSAIINPPQAAILAVGAVERRPVVKGKAIKAAYMMSVTLSADHRVVDGALAAEFLATFKKLVEQPLTVVL